MRCAPDGEQLFDAWGHEAAAAAEPEAPSAPGQPEHEGQPGDNEDAIQRALYVANYAAAVDAALEVRPGPCRLLGPGDSVHEFAVGCGSY
jgi:hypothetical protein